MSRGVQECSACTHIDRKTIDEALRARMALRKLAGLFGLSAATLCRHRAHLEAPATSQGDAGGTDGLLATADAAIAELRSLQRRARRNKNAAAGAELTLKASRELRSWIVLRAQLLSKQTTVPIKRSEPEVDDARLKKMAEVYLTRHPEKPN
jgi:hypothetical protein